MCQLLGVLVLLSVGSPLEATQARILFVSQSTTADQILIAHLEQNGYQVESETGSTVTEAFAGNFDLALVSNSVSSGNVGNKLTNATVPVITWEALLFGNFGLSGNQIGDYGSSRNQTQIDIADDSHPLAAGLSGTLAVTSDMNRIYWGKPGSHAINIAHLVGDPTRSTIFANEAGSLLANGDLAPARRIGLFIGDHAPANLTPAGLRLFDAAIAWALESTVVTADSVRIMPLGDSITQGYGLPSYRHKLSELLLDQQCRFNFVGSENGPDPAPGDTSAFDRDHEGHSGWRTDQIENSLPVWIADNQADWVLIHLGTNDILQGESVYEAAQNLADMIDILRARNPGIGILLAQIIPIRAKNETVVIELNQEIAGLVDSKSQPGVSPLLLVDHYTGYDSPTMNRDMIHPNLVGERFMAKRWLQVLLPEIQQFCH